MKSYEKNFRVELTHKYTFKYRFCYTSMKTFATVRGEKHGKWDIGRKTCEAMPKLQNFRAI
jgi:hypothetical protein